MKPIISLALTIAVALPSISQANVGDIAALNPKIELKVAQSLKGMGLSQMTSTLIRNGYKVQKTRIHNCATIRKYDMVFDQLLDETTLVEKSTQLWVAGTSDNILRSYNSVNCATMPLDGLTLIKVSK